MTVGKFFVHKSVGFTINDKSAFSDHLYFRVQKFSIKIKRSYGMVQSIRS